MAIAHAQSGDPIDIRPLGPRLATEKNIALFKSEQLEVIRLVLLAGKVFPAHAVPGEITVQCIEGEIDITVEGQSHVLKAGEILFLAGNVPHGVVALQDSSALLTIVLKPGA